VASDTKVTLIHTRCTTSNIQSGEQAPLTPLDIYLAILLSAYRSCVTRFWTSPVHPFHDGCEILGISP